MADLIFCNGPYSGKGLNLPPGKSLVIGRSREADVPLPDLKLSRRHCQLEGGLAGYILRDFGSTNGTYLNGRRVEGEVQLRHGDRLLIGDMEMEFHCPEQNPDVQTVLAPAPPVTQTTAQRATESMSKPSAESESEPIPAASAAAIMQQNAQQRLVGVLAELAQPLPPLPPPPAVPATSAPVRAVSPSAELLPFICDGCGGGIPKLDADMGEAGRIGTRYLCRQCHGAALVVGSSGTSEKLRTKDKEAYELVPDVPEAPTVVQSRAPWSSATGTKPAPAPSGALETDDDLLEEILPDDANA